MGRPNSAMIQSILAKSPAHIETAVETGSHQGDGTLILSREFKTVYTIELADHFYQEAKQKCAGLTNVTHILGDSRDHLPRLALQLWFPVFWYLDAHWFQTPAGATAGSFPLWEELEILCKRSYEEIIVVDDVHAFGLDRPDEFYKPWKSTTVETITAFVEKRRKVSLAEVVGDEFVLYVRG